MNEHASWWNLVEKLENPLPFTPTSLLQQRGLSIHLRKPPAACLLQALVPFAKNPCSVSSSFLRLFSNPLSRSTRPDLPNGPVESQISS
ncbi:hypothetical protein AAC387_Pa06g2006 [Persea americana]